jgi:hypothetical protein
MLGLSGVQVRERGEASVGAKLIRAGWVTASIVESQQGNIKYVMTTD